MNVTGAVPTPQKCSTCDASSHARNRSADSLHSDEMEGAASAIDSWIAGLQTKTSGNLPVGDGSQVQARSDAEQAAWLADKITALGDYAKEAAQMLRRWPVGGAGMVQAQSAELWSKPNPLQIDSYATGRQLAHATVLRDCIAVEATDGDNSYKARLPLPWVKHG